MTEIRIEKVMEMLELPMEIVFKLSSLTNIEEQIAELANVKAIVLTQKRKLIEKYRPEMGVYVLGASEEKIKEIERLANFIMQLHVTPFPSEIMNINRI